MDIDKIPPLGILWLCAAFTLVSSEPSTRIPVKNRSLEGQTDEQDKEEMLGQCNQNGSNRFVWPHLLLPYNKAGWESLKTPEFSHFWH